MCCAGACTGSHCINTPECMALNPSNGYDEESAISPIDPTVECIYSETAPRAFRHECANPNTCTSGCSKSEIPNGFCQYCPYILEGTMFAPSYEGQEIPALNFAVSHEGTTIASQTIGANLPYGIHFPPTECIGYPLDIRLSLFERTSVDFSQLGIYNYPHQIVPNFTQMRIPRVPGDVDEDIENGITQSLSNQRNASAVTAVEVSVDQTLVKIASENPTAPIRFNSYNITLTYLNEDVPNHEVPGEKEKFSEAAEVYKCGSEFFLFGNTCTGQWKNSSEIGGVILEKAITETGGIIKASNYTAFSGVVLGIPVTSTGPCERDSDCETGCCGSPTWQGLRYCTDCLPQDCVEGFCECTGWASPECQTEPPVTVPGGTTTTVPIGCATDGDCSTGHNPTVGCFFCANTTFDPLANPYGPNQCLECSSTQDGICMSPNCVGCDPDCCFITPDCTPLGDNYYCANETLDGNALSVGVCTECDDSGSKDGWVPDPICAGLDYDFCSTTVECTDANTFCACQDDSCMFGICMAKRGNFCESESDCAANTYCSRTAHLCTSRCFLSVSPNRISTKLSNLKIFKAILSDPIGKEATYRLKIVDTGTYASGAPFATFLDGKKTMVVTVPKNGRKEVPIQFRAAALGEYDILVSAVSTEFSGSAQEGINSDQCAPNAASAKITVQAQTSAGGQFLSAPGIGVAEVGVIAALAGLFFVVFDRTRK